MDNEKAAMSRWPSRIRRIARIWSALYLVTLVLIIIMELLYPHGGEEAMRPRDLVLIAFIPVGTFFGMALAWRWEGLGGAISTLSVLGFYVAMFILDGDLPQEGILILLPLIIPGVLFLISWALHRQESDQI